MENEAEAEPVGSSRIYVTGLPTYLDEKRLRDIFSERGEVTDAKIMRTRDGRSRQFGFVGFQTVDQAGEAIHYFDKSYIDTSRLQVKYAERTQSSNLQRPWSQHSKGSSRFAKRERAAEEGSAEKPKVRELIKQKRAKFKTADPAESNPELQEFLRVMQPRNKAAIWANDDAVPEAAQPGEAPRKRRRVAAAEGSGSDGEGDEDEEIQDLSGNVAPKGSRKRKATTAEVEDAEEDGGEEEGEPGDAVVADAAVSDMDYLKSRVKGKAFEDDSQDEDSSSEEEEESDQEEDDSDEEAEDEDSQESEGTGVTEAGAGHGDEADDMAQRQNSHRQAGPSGGGSGDEPPPVSETGRLFLRNLPYQATEADLAALFEEYGELSEVHLVVDRSSRKSKGFALVQFIEPDEAAAAAAALDGSIFQGRLLHILPAKPAPAIQTTEADDNEAEEKPAGFKQQRAAEQKAGAGNRAAWNTLFMRPDTVAEAVAAHYGVTKSQLLDKEAADLPVRMALGEAHVIAMTKQGLEEAGVDVAALERAAAASGRAAGQGAGAAVERSGTALLVKNLPYATTEDELLETFGRAGTISRLVLPETRTLALVEYREPAEARRAFKSLAFKRFHAAPLFLEWAPAGVFTSDAPPLKLPKVHKEESEEPRQEAVAVVLERGGGEDDAESCSVYVKNLAWATEDKGLAKHFDATVSAAGGSIRAAKVTKRKGADGKMLSAGYGFVECSSEAAARAAVKKLQGSMLGGHKLVLQLSMKKDIAGPSTAKKAAKDKNAKGTKVVVRNVAFEATSKEIRALFQPFGQIKSVRLPRKFDNSHRGFAFVDFLSHQEAVNAMEAVAGTHLYGRRLVTEWADQDEGLDELRAKTASKFQA